MVNSGPKLDSKGQTYEIFPHDHTVKDYIVK